VKSDASLQPHLLLPVAPAYSQCAAGNSSPLLSDGCTEATTSAVDVAPAGSGACAAEARCGVWASRRPKHMAAATTATAAAAGQHWRRQPVWVPVIRALIHATTNNKLPTLRTIQPIDMHDRCHTARRHHITRSTSSFPLQQIKHQITTNNVCNLHLFLVRVPLLFGWGDA
jgi:hypothetical protein